MKRASTLAVAVLASWILLAGRAPEALAQDAVSASPAEVSIYKSDIKPKPLAVFTYGAAMAEGSSEVAKRWKEVIGVVKGDLASSGYFTLADYVGVDAQGEKHGIKDVFTSPTTNDWNLLKLTGKEFLVTSDVAPGDNDTISFRFRLWDVANKQQWLGLQISGKRNAVRRIGHRAADAIYARITGNGPYFDTRVAFVSETGEATRRHKRLALMDHDGAGVKYLTSKGDLALTPRFSPNGQQLAYVSFAQGRAHVYLADIETGVSERLFMRRSDEVNSREASTFAPRFSSDGKYLVMSMESGGNSDIYLLDLEKRGVPDRLTWDSAIDTAPSFSPHYGIVFESDRGGHKQIWIMNKDGKNKKKLLPRSDADRAVYGTPVWAPSGKSIAFTRQLGDKWQIGVLDWRSEDSGELDEPRYLTEDWHAEGPTWAPNSQMLMFFGTKPNTGESRLWAVNVRGGEPAEIKAGTGASDPAWSPLLSAGQ